MHSVFGQRSDMKLCVCAFFRSVSGWSLSVGQWALDQLCLRQRFGSHWYSMAISLSDFMNFCDVLPSFRPSSFLLYRLRAAAHIGCQRALGSCWVGPGSLYPLVRPRPTLCRAVLLITGNMATAADANKQLPRARDRLITAGGELLTCRKALKSASEET